MSVLPLLTAFLALQGGATKSKFSIDVFLLKGTTPTAIKGGDSLTGEVTFVVKPVTTNPIQAIELYVGDDLRETDGSTPYEFKLDTLAEEDGPINLRFKGFTSEGENAEKVLTLSIDNGVSLGAAAHVAKGVSSTRRSPKVESRLKPTKIHFPPDFCWEEHTSQRAPLTRPRRTQRMFWK